MHRLSFWGRDVTHAVWWLLACLALVAAVQAARHLKGRDPVFYPRGVAFGDHWKAPPLAMLGQRSSRPAPVNSEPVVVRGITPQQMSLFKKLSLAVPASGIPEELRYRPTIEAGGARQRVVAHLAWKFGAKRDLVNAVAVHAMSAGRATDIDPLLILALASVESGLKPSAYNSSGATGLMQVIPRYVPDILNVLGGVQRSSDPEVNVFTGSLILRRLLAQSGTLREALRRYAGASEFSPVVDTYHARVLTELGEIERAVGIELGL